MRGHVSLGDLADAGIDLPVDSEAYTSVGGYVFDELGRLPKRGDKITPNGYSIRVESVRENRVEAVRIPRRPSAARGAARAAPDRRDRFRPRPSLACASSVTASRGGTHVVRGFTESQLETLKALIRIQGEVGADLEGALEALELARWDDLPDAQLPWAR